MANITFGINNNGCGNYVQYIITVDGEHYVTGWIRHHEYENYRIHFYSPGELAEKIKKMYYWLF